LKRTSQDSRPLAGIGDPEAERVAWEQFVSARNKRDIAVLVSLINLPYKAKSPPPCLEDCTAPTSIGGQAVLALAQIALSTPESVAKALENDLLHLSEYIECWSPELQDPSILLLHHISPTLHPLLKARLVNLTGFNGLRRMLRAVSPVKRLLALETCVRLFSNSDNRKERFLDRDGAEAVLFVVSNGDLKTTKIALEAACELILVYVYSGMRRISRMKAVPAS
jgi:hypothetical protein